MIVLDTHVWLWWVADPRQLTSRAHKTITEAEAVGICAISCWEIAMLVQKRRLGLDRDVLVWIRRALALPRLTLLPITPEIAVAAATLLESFPADPADRLIVATALNQVGILVTRDERIRRFERVNSVW